MSFIHNLKQTKFNLSFGIHDTPNIISDRIKAFETTLSDRKFSSINGQLKKDIQKRVYELKNILLGLDSHIISGICGAVPLGYENGNDDINWIQICLHRFHVESALLAQYNGYSTTNSSQTSDLGRNEWFVTFDKDLIKKSDIVKVCDEFLLVNEHIVILDISYTDDYAYCIFSLSAREAYKCFNHLLQIKGVVGIEENKGGHQKSL